MPVIAVVNRKGGSGKSTIATHIAAYCAHQKIPVMLGDVDKQQSTRSWLRLREQRQAGASAIMGWAVNQSSALRTPTGVSHVVLDTPGGLHGLDLARVVMYADAVLMPVCNSVFDRDSAAQCLDELKQLPRIVTKRCRLAMVGMRVDNRTLDSAALMQWAIERKLDYLGALRDSPSYVQCIEQGVTLFDLPVETVSQDLAQWQPILNWLQPVLYPTPVATNSLGKPPESERAMSARVGSLQPVQQSLVAGERLAASPRSANTDTVSQAPPAAGAHGGFFEALGLPNFLRRK